MVKNKPKVISLFSGCGGLDLGFVQEGFDIVWANDFFHAACETYKKILRQGAICCHFAQ